MNDKVDDLIRGDSQKGFDVTTNQRLGQPT